MRFILKVEVRVYAIRALGMNTLAAFSPVTAARSASGNKLFPAKGKAAIPSVTRDKLYFYGIYKQTRNSTKRSFHRVGGGLTTPSSHTTGHTVPYPAVQ